VIRKILFFILALALLAVIGFAICVYLINQAGKGRVFDRVDTIPAREVGLVLGVSERRPDGGINYYFQNRIAAAARLFHEGKVKHLLLSGDNHINGYNEPEAMKRALIALHVPPNVITLDYAGLRTLDSIVRAEKVFGLKQFTIISQREHDERALLIARHYGIDAIAYAADDIAFKYAVNSHIHEWLAQVKVILDLYLLHTAPKHLGAKEIIN